MLTFLLYTLACFAFLGCGFILSRRAMPLSNAWASGVVSLPLSLALMLVSIGVLGRILHQFEYVVLLGAGLCAGLGLVLVPGKKQGLPALSWRLALKWVDVPLLLVVAVLTFLVIGVTFKYAIFDEIRLQGHLAVAESMLRGKFPPAYTAFPDIPYKYHYGFNILAAICSRIFSLPGYLGVDIATIFCWVALTIVLIYFLVLIGIPRKALGLAYLFVTFSGGLSWLLVHHAETLGEIYQLPQWQQLFIYWRAVHPNFIMYFFQHPMGLGMILFFGTLIYFKDWLETKRLSSLLLAAMILGALSLAQVMLFATLLAAFGLLFLIRFFQREVRPVANLRDGVLLAVLAVSLALLLGGFLTFSPNLENQPLLLSWPPGYLRYEFYGSRHPIGLYPALVWYLGGFGLFLFLVPWAGYRCVRQKSQLLWLLGIFAVLCFMVPQFFRYQYSWDIIKWFFGFDLAARLLVAWAYLPWASRRVWTLLLAWVFVLFGIITPFRLMTELIFKDPAKFTRAENRFAAYRQPVPRGAIVPLIEKMNHCEDCYGMIWSSAGTSVGLAMHTGFPTLQMDHNTVAMPVSRTRIAERREFLQTLENAPSLELLKQMELRWIIFSCSEVLRLKPQTQAFIETLRKTPGVQDFSISGPEGCLLALKLEGK